MPTGLQGNSCQEAVTSLRIGRQVKPVAFWLLRTLVSSFVFEPLPKIRKRRKKVVRNFEFDQQELGHVMELEAKYAFSAE